MLYLLRSLRMWGRPWRKCVRWSTATVTCSMRSSQTLNRRRASLSCWDSLTNWTSCRSGSLQPGSAKNTFSLEEIMCFPCWRLEMFWWWAKSGMFEMACHHTNTIIAVCILCTVCYLFMCVCLLVKWIVHPKMKISSPLVNPRCWWVCFFIRFGEM